MKLIKEHIDFIRDEGIKKSLDVGDYRSEKIEEIKSDPHLEEWMQFKEYGSDEKYMEWLNSFDWEENKDWMRHPDESLRTAKWVDKAIGHYLTIGKTFDWKEDAEMMDYIMVALSKNPDYFAAYDALPSTDTFAVIFSEIELPNADKLEFK